jgi:hypothetical protein
VANAPVMKAIPVRPGAQQQAESGTPVEVRKAQPVGPLDEQRDRNLLQSATPAPDEDDH